MPSNIGKCSTGGSFVQGEPDRILGSQNDMDDSEVPEILQVALECYDDFENQLATCDPNLSYRGYIQNGEGRDKICYFIAIMQLLLRWMALYQMMLYLERLNEQVRTTTIEDTNQEAVVAVIKIGKLLLIGFYIPISPLLLTAAYTATEDAAEIKALLTRDGIADVSFYQDISGTPNWCVQNLFHELFIIRKNLVPQALVNAGEEIGVCEETTLYQIKLSYHYASSQQNIIEDMFEVFFGLQHQFWKDASKITVPVTISLQVSRYFVIHSQPYDYEAGVRHGRTDTVVKNLLAILLNMNGDYLCGILWSYVLYTDSHYVTDVQDKISVDACSTLYDDDQVVKAAVEGSALACYGRLLLKEVALFKKTTTTVTVKSLRSYMWTSPGHNTLPSF